MATVETPTLVDGERLTRDEFMRRWEALPHLRWAELIKGIVRMPSPTSKKHSRYHFNLSIWLGHFATYTRGIEGHLSSTCLMLTDAPQPDCHLSIVPEAGGRARPSREYSGQYLEGGMELAAEVSLSSAHYDLHDKLGLYEEAGVVEYLVILLKEREIRWFIRKNKIFKPMPAPRDGIWRSRVFPGLWLDDSAFLAGDMPKVLATLQDGLASPEHAAFSRKLAARLKS